MKIVSIIEKLRFLFLFFIILIFCLSKALDAQFDLLGLTDFFLFILIVCSLAVIGKGAKILLGVLLGVILIELLLLGISIFFDRLFISSIKPFFTMLYFLIMAGGCLHYTLLDKEINVTTLFGSLSAYLFIGLAYAYLYLFILTTDAEALIGLKTSFDSNTIYYSFVTLTTLGFGDVLPKSPIAQTVSWMESFTGQAYLAIIMGQLVGRYIADRFDKKS